MPNIMQWVPFYHKLIGKMTWSYVQYALLTLNNDQSRYSPTDREGLAGSLHICGNVEMIHIRTWIHYCNGS